MLKYFLLLSFQETSINEGDERRATLATPGITTFLLKPNDFSLLVIDAGGVRKYCYSNL